MMDAEQTTHGQTQLGRDWDLDKTLFGVIYDTASHRMYEQALPGGITPDMLDREESVQVLEGEHGVKWLRTDFGDSGMGWMVDVNNDGEEVDATEVKFVTLLTDEQFGPVLLDNLYLTGAENTCGSLGTAEPDLEGESDLGFYTTFGWAPAFAMNASSYDCIASAYVTPYPFAADGTPITELDESDFDALVAALRERHGF